MDQAGAVYQYSKDGILRRIISTGSFPNGIAVSPDDSTLAVADYACQPHALLFVPERTECRLHPMCQ